MADVPRYPEFLPWCTAARVRKKEGPNVEVGEIAIGFGPFHEKFVSRVVLTPDDPERPAHRDDGNEGPFRALASHWLFQPHPDGTMIVFALEFEFRSRLLQHTVRAAVCRGGQAHGLCLRGGRRPWRSWHTSAAS